MSKRTGIILLAAATALAGWSFGRAVSRRSPPAPAPAEAAWMTLAGAGVEEGSDTVGSAQDEAAYAAARHRMVERQIVARGVGDPAVLAALRAVPRHEFVLEESRGQAYEDYPLPIGSGQTISQPYIVALMTEALALAPGSRVLELGTGSGYQASVLAAIADSVWSIEYFPTLAKEARERLARLGYGNVTTRVGDGWEGWPEHAPYDAIMITFAAPEIPPRLPAQLKPGGRLCLPLGEPHGHQALMLYTKREDGTLVATGLGPVRFVPVQRGKPGREPPRQP